MKFAFAKRSHLGDPRFVNITDVSAVSADGGLPFTLSEISGRLLMLVLVESSNTDSLRNEFKILEDMDSEEFAAEIREKINDTETLPISEYGGAANARRSMGTTHACFIGPNGDAISITSSLNMK